MKPVNIVETILNGLNYEEGSDQVDCLSEAIVMCSEAIKILKSRRFHLKHRNHLPISNDASVIQKASMLSLCSENLLVICSYIDITSTVCFRFCSMSIHISLMDCPLDLTKLNQSKITQVNLNSASIINSLLPLSLVSKTVQLNDVGENVRDETCCVSSRLFDLLAIGSTLTPNTSSTSKNTSKGKSVATYGYNGLSLSELQSHGFHRPWTITGLLLDDDFNHQTNHRVPLLINNLYKYNAHSKITKLKLGNIQGILETLMLSLSDQVNTGHLLPNVNEISCRCDDVYPHLQLNIGSLSNVTKLKVGGIKKLTFFYVNVHGDLSCLSGDNKSGSDNDDGMMGSGKTCGLDSVDNGIMLSLEHLVLQQTIITGSLSSLRKLVNLTYLNISDNRNLEVGCDLTFLINLSHLKHLDLHNSEVIGDILALAHLDKLTYLNISNNYRIKGELTSISFSLLSLEHIDIGYTSIKGDLNDLSCFSRLKVLDVEHTSITGDLSCFQTPHNDHSHNSFQYLEEVWLGSSSVKGDIAHVASLVYLRELLIDNVVEVYGDIECLLPLVSHGKLYVINLSYTSVSGSMDHFINKCEEHNEAVKIESDLKNRGISLVQFHLSKTLVESATQKSRLPFLLVCNDDQMNTEEDEGEWWNE